MLTSFSSHFPEILIAGGQLLAVVKMFKRESSNWVVSFQRHSPAGASCGAMHAKRYFIACGILCSITFSFQCCNFPYKEHSELCFEIICNCILPTSARSEETSIRFANHDLVDIVFCYNISNTFAPWI